MIGSFARQSSFSGGRILLANPVNDFNLSPTDKFKFMFVNPYAGGPLAASGEVYGIGFSPGQVNPSLSAFFGFGGAFSVDRASVAEAYPYPSGMTTLLSVLPSGFVGIGVADAADKLHVAGGKIRADDGILLGDGVQAGNSATIHGGAGDPNTIGTLNPLQGDYFFRADGNKNPLETMYQFDGATWIPIYCLFPQPPNGDLIIDSPTGDVGLTSETGNIPITGKMMQLFASLILDRLGAGDVPVNGPCFNSPTFSVDVKSSFTINQQTPGIDVTLPIPTDPTGGRIAFVSNVGAVSFAMYGKTVAPGQVTISIYDGGWKALV